MVEIRKNVKCHRLQLTQHVIVTHTRTHTHFISTSLSMIEHLLQGFQDLSVSVVQLSSILVIQFFIGSVLQYFSGSVFQWFSCPEVQYFSGSVVYWFSGSGYCYSVFFWPLEALLFVSRSDLKTQLGMSGQGGEDRWGRLENLGLLLIFISFLLAKILSLSLWEKKQQRI